MQNPFVWSGNQPVDQNQLATRRALANALINKSLDTSPVQHWTQALARVAQGVAGMRQGQFADEDEAARRERGEKAGQGLLAAIGLSPSADASAAPAAASQGGLVNVTPPPPQNPLTNTAPMAPASSQAPAPATGGMQEIMKTSMAEFVEAFPEMKDRITSGYRDPSRNAAVGGAKGSQHIQGNAIDFSVAGLPEDRQQAMAEWWRNKGAGGFGYYPNKGAMHVDFGAQRAWGPNYSRTSLGDTPQWFQGFVAGPRSAQAQNAPPQQVASLGASGSTPMQERTIGAVVRNGVANEAAASGQAQPVQVAQAQQSVPTGQPQLAPQLPPRPNNTDAQLAAAVKAMNDPDMPPAYRELAKGFVDRALAARNKDPLETRAKQLQVQQLEAQTQMTPLQREQMQLSNEKTRRELGRADMETMTAPDGTVFEREKGKPGAQWRESIKLPSKPEDRTSYQRELDQVNAERKANNLPPMRLDEYKLQQARAGATNINNDITGGSSKQIFDEQKERYAAARSAASGLNSIAEARKAVKEGGFFGAGADQRLGFAKLGAMLGFEDGRITNTETFRAAIAPQVAAVLRSVAGTANLSNADREFAEKAAGGSITLDQKSITRLLDIMERGNKAIVSEYQATLDEIYPQTDDKKFARERALFGVRLPQPLAAPQGATPSAPQSPATPQPGKVLVYNPATGMLE